MTEYRNRTFYYIVGCLYLIVCEGEHTTLLWLLVTSPTLVVSSLLTLGVLLLTRVLLPLLALGVLQLLLLVLGPLLAQLVLRPLLVLLGLWSWWPGCISRCLRAVPNKVIRTPTTVAPIVGQATLLCTMSCLTASSASDGSWLLNLLLLLWVMLLRSLTLASVSGEAPYDPAC